MNDTLPPVEALELVLGDELAPYRQLGPYDHETYLKWLPIIDWNNEADRTGDQVITACRAAARRAEELAS